MFKNRVKSQLYKPTARKQSNETIQVVKAESIFNENQETLKHEMIDKDRAVNLFHALMQFKKEQKYRNHSQSKTKNTSAEDPTVDLKMGNETYETRNHTSEHMTRTVDVIRRVANQSLTEDITASQLRDLKIDDMPKKKKSMFEIEKKKDRDWRKFLGLMKKNPEMMMSIMEKPVPSICEATSYGANMA